MGKIKFKPPAKRNRPSAGPIASVAVDSSARNPAKTQPTKSKRQLVCPEGSSTSSCSDGVPLAKIQPTNLKGRPLTRPKGPSTSSHKDRIQPTNLNRNVAEGKKLRETPNDVYTFKSSSPVKGIKHSRRDGKMRKLARRRDIMQAVLKVISRTRQDIARLRALKKKAAPEQ